MKYGKLLLVIKAVLMALVILSGAIAIPILLRSFFYWHIAPMHLGQSLGLDTEQVKTAYREMMDYCIGISDTFSVGELSFSESGAAHFADVRALFLLDLRVFTVSAVLLTALCLSVRGKHCLAGHRPGFWSAVGLSTSFALVAGLVALDFDRAFTVFHSLFFPGKTNWLFYPDEDPVILLLPAEFFRNCALLILAGILIPCAGLIFWDLYKKEKRVR